MHDLPIVSTITAGLTAAWLLGLLTQRLGLSPIVGYLLAGVAIGPHTPGFAGDVQVAHQLAEFGVILLMFGVGLHFHWKDLLAVKSLAIPGAIGQSLVAAALAALVFVEFGLPLKTSVVIGMALAVASTVVLMRVLEDAQVLMSPQGLVAVGWLIVEDIITVILLVLIPVMDDKSTAAPWQSLGLALLKLAALVALVLFGGSRIMPRVLVRVARLRSRELFTLTVLVFSIAIAAGAYYFFGASMALGAFLAGMVVAQSPVSHQAAADALPLRDAFSVIFFVSVGMLFDPAFLLERPFMIAAALAIILVAKPLAALAIVAILGHSARTALTVALGLAQIGEFSFILSELARRHGLMPDAGHNVLVASAIISITINPLLFRSLEPIESWLRSRPRLWWLINGRAEARSRRTNAVAAEQIARQTPVNSRLAIVVGFGPVGRSVQKLLRDAGLATVVVDMNMDTIAELSASGQRAIYGDAARAAILELAGVAQASHLVLTLPHSTDRTMIVGIARTLNPNVRILVRARYLRERAELEQVGANAAVFEEAESAVGLARLVLTDAGVHRAAVEQRVRDLRWQLIRDNFSNMRTQHVRSVMEPWTRVRRLSKSMSRDELFQLVSEHRFTRWPVVDPVSGLTVGYLLTKDLIAQAPSGLDWTSLIRPLHSVGPDDDVESTLIRMQTEGASLAVVEDAGKPIGLITLEDILEQLVGRIEDEYPHEPELNLRNAVATVVLGLENQSRDDVIRELAAAIPPERLPPGANIAELAIAREEEFSTDLGVGVAIPHARCPNLAQPLVAVGRSDLGVTFSDDSDEPVRLIFLLVTPPEQAEVQLSLLSQLASAARDEEHRRRLLDAATPAEIVEAL